MNVSGNSPNPASFPGAESPGTDVAISPGAYSVSESGPSGYTSDGGSADCSGSIALGQTKTCTFVNDDQAAHLIVIKHVINDDEGTAVAADFTLDSGGANDSPDNFPGSEAGTNVTLDAGSYNVDEAAHAGYTKSFSADCSGSIANGETKTCTVTNDDIAPPPVSQITPTATTCTQFSQGNAQDLDTLRYTVQGGQIHQVSPGVFFYWVTVTATAGQNTFTIHQNITTGNFSTFFTVASGSSAFRSDCVKLNTQISQSGADTTVTFNASSAGTYIIGIKYSANSVVGANAPNPTTVHYDISTNGVPGSTDGLDLKKKGTI